MRYFLILVTRLCCGILARRLSNDFLASSSVLYANHTSHLDIMVVVAALPRILRGRLRPVAAQEYWGRNAFRRYLACNIFKAILIDRIHPSGARETFREINNSLNKGCSILIFPEGGRKTNLETKDVTFHAGIYLIAQMRPETPFVPVALEGFWKTLPKGEFLPAPNMGSVTFGHAVTLHENESRDSFMERCTNAWRECAGV